MPRKDLAAKYRALQPKELEKGLPADTPEGQIYAAASEVARKQLVEEAAECPSQHLVLNSFEMQRLERERDILSRAVIEEKRELGRASFWYFITQIMFPDSWKEHYSEEFHKPLCDMIQGLPGSHNLWFFLPREFRKSYILTMLHTWWLIVRNPDIRILLVGAREETVKPFARLVLSAFLPGTPGFQEFRRVYSDFVIEGTGHLRQAFQFTHPLRTKALADPTFRAAYLGVTGAGWRCDVLKFDDPVERRNISTPDQAAKTMRQMLDLLPLVYTGSEYRNIIGAGTRWSYLDPYGRIIGDSFDMEEAVNLRSENTDVIIRHALEHPTDPCTDCPEYVLAAHPHNKFDLDEGHPPDHPVHTRQMILSRYEEYKIDPDKGESLFYHQYGNICLAPSDQKFHSEWIITAPFPFHPSPKYRALCVDAADKDFRKDATGGDWMCALFGEFDDFGRLFLVHGLMSNQWTRAQFIKHIITWCLATKWWPNRLGKEKFGDDGAYFTDLQNAFWEHKQPVHAKVVSRPEGTTAGTSMKKLDWIVQCLQTPMENAMVVFCRDFPLTIRRQVEAELVNLGQMRRDDAADTLALFYSKEIRPPDLVPNHGWAGQDMGIRPPDLMLFDHTFSGPSVDIEPPPAEDPVRAACARPGIQLLFGGKPPNTDNHHHELPFIIPDL